MFLNFKDVENVFINSLVFDQNKMNSVCFIISESNTSYI